MLNIKANKESKLTDWSKRPLTKKQCEYAANDVKDLIELHKILHKRLDEKKRVSWIEEEIMQNDVVREVVYSKSLVDLVNENVKQISLFILVFCSLLFLIAIALINNTIRLNIYSKRFLIRTMQLVGATRRFIRKPFIISGISHGIYAGIIAIAFLSGCLYLAQKEIPELIELQDVELIGTIFIGVILLGIIISWISTLMAVRKYLKLKTDELYF